MNYLALFLEAGFTTVVVLSFLAWFRRGSDKQRSTPSDSAKGESPAEGKHFTEQYLRERIRLAELFTEQYLRESIRLAELLIDQLDLAKSDLDRKGYWLAAFCIGALGFVLNEWKESAFIEEMILYLATIPFLFIGLIYAVRSLGLKSYGPKGLPPGIAVGKSFKDINHSGERMSLLLYHTLTEYLGKIDTSGKSNEVKVDDIKVAMKWIVIGAVLLTCAFLFPLFVKLSSQIQAWAHLLAGLWPLQFCF